MWDFHLSTSSQWKSLKFHQLIFSLSMQAIIIINNSSSSESVLQLKPFSHSMRINYTLYMLQITEKNSVTDFQQTTTMMCVVRDWMRLTVDWWEWEQAKKLLLHGFENRLSLIAQVIALSIESDCFIYTLPLICALSCCSIDWRFFIACCDLMCV